MIKYTLLFFLTCSAAYTQIIGCTDPLSKNYDPKATLNNDSCLYPTFKIKPTYSKQLSDSIKETSGLIAFDHLLWTHNDDHDKTLYGLDPLGKIQKKIILNQATNGDWEEIAQDSTYLYIGDFGNNLTGNRSDLHILKIEKKSFLAGTPNITTLSFTFSDQTDFRSKKPNSTHFDCEAFIVSKDSIYLFNKQWDSSKTSVYALPNQAGHHIAQLKNTLNTQGLITGATYLESKKLIVLCGYSKIGKPFLYLLYDYKNNDFFSGNKRRLTIQLPFHQIEAITTQDGLHYYVTNEALIRRPLLHTPQQIHHIDLSSILSQYLSTMP
jgi:hypothetical protein